MLNFLRKLMTRFPKEYKDYRRNQLTLQIFIRAEQEGATEVLFGVPPGMSFDRAISDIYDQSPDDEVKEFAKSQGLDFKEPEPFEMSAIPIFMKIKNEWRQVFDIPMCLHTDCIEYIKSNSADFTTAEMKIELPLEGSVSKFNFNTNENFNYLASDLKFEKF